MLNAVVHATTPQPPARRAEPPPVQSPVSPSSGALQRSHTPTPGHETRSGGGGRSNGNGSNTGSSPEKSVTGSHTDLQRREYSPAVKRTEYDYVAAHSSRTGGVVHEQHPVVHAELSRSVHDGAKLTPLLSGFADGLLVKASVLEAGWHEFVKSLPQSLAALKFTLTSRENCSVKFFDGEVLILNSEKFMVDDLMARRTTLDAQLQKFFKSPIRIKVVHSTSLHDHPPSVDEKSRSGSQSFDETNDGQPVSSAEGPLEGVDEKSKIENVIVELFGAKKIPMSGL